jgi:hypothetical protein
MLICQLTSLPESEKIQKILWNHQTIFLKTPTPPNHQQVTKIIIPLKTDWPQHRKRFCQFSTTNTEPPKNCPSNHHGCPSEKIARRLIVVFVCLCYCTALAVCACCTCWSRRRYSKALTKTMGLLVRAGKIPEYCCSTDRPPARC